jgi:hypothetical protein
MGLAATGKARKNPSARLVARSAHLLKVCRGGTQNHTFLFTVEQGAPPDYALMEASAPIQCPYCGQTFELVIDTAIASQCFTTDCEVCCRPFEVTAECAPGEILSLDARAG